MLDGQAPDIQVVTDGIDDIDDKAAIDTDSQTEATEDERDLIDIISQRTWPSDTNMALQERA